MIQLPAFHFRRSHIWPAAVVLFLYLMLGALYLNHYDWNVGAFSRIGQGSSIGQLFSNDGIYLDPPGAGYDGQFYYVLARRPFDFETVSRVIDFPAWRYQRIVYPLTVWFLSLFGHATLVALFLPLVNIVSVGMSVYLLGRLLERYALNPWLSLLYGLSPGLIFSFFYNLAEPLAYFFVIAAVYYFLNNRFIRSTIFLTIAALTKEICLLVAVGFMLFLLLTRPSGYFKKVLLYAVPVVVFITWLIVLKILFSAGTYAPIVDFNLGMPFAGFMIKVKLLFASQASFHTLLDVFFYFISLVGAIFIVNNFFRGPTIYTTIGVLYVALAITFAPTLLLFPKEYTRNFIGLSLFLFLSYPLTKSKATLILLAGYVLSGVLYFSEMFFFRNIFY